MQKVFIINTSSVCSMGSGINTIFPHLLAGESAVSEITRFDTSRLEFHKAAYIPGLEKNPFNNMMCELTSRALAGLSHIPSSPYIIWTGIKNDAEQIQRLNENSGEKTLYLPAQYRKWIAERLTVENRGMEINAACASSTAGLAIGAEMIRSGEEECILVIGADIVSRFTHMGFAALRALSPSICRPFDKNRDGLALGEGASAIILASEKYAEKNSISPLAEIAGWAITNDATHITAPAKDGCGLTAAINKSLASAGMEKDEIEAFCAHGTGTVYNDAMELTAIENVFGARKFPVFSVKGSIGHTLGAAGSIESDIAVRALREKKIPPTVNFAEHEERTVGRVCNLPQSFPGNNILKTNSGFGGVNSALIFKKA